MYKWLGILITFLLFSSCREESLTTNTCNADDPVTEIDWISDLIHELEQNNSDISHYFYLFQANLDGSTVFVLNNCCPFCNTTITVQDCSGNIIGTIGKDFDIGELQHIKIIWKPVDFACSI